MKFRVVLAVKDIKAARVFYEELFGLKVADNFGHCVAFECGLTLQQNFGWLTGLLDCEIKDKANNCEMCFEELNFDRLVQKIKAYPGVHLLHDVMEQPWGQRVIRFYDLDNHLVELGEDMKYVIERFISQGMDTRDIAEKMDMNTENINRMLNILSE